LICQKFTAKTAGERSLKIGYHSAKLEAKIEWHRFSGTVCIYYY